MSMPLTTYELLAQLAADIRWLRLREEWIELTEAHKENERRDREKAGIARGEYVLDYDGKPVWVPPPPPPATGSWTSPSQTKWKKGRK